MTPELRPLPDALPDALRWTHTQRRMAWLFDGSACVGSLGFSGYGRASGLTSRGVWHLRRLGVLHQGIDIAPADGRHPPLMMRQTWSFDGTLDLPGADAVTWRAMGSAMHAWAFERKHDGTRLFTFEPAGDMHAETSIRVSPAARDLPDPSPLLLLGAFLVRMSVDDSAVIAGA